MDQEISQVQIKVRLHLIVQPPYPAETQKVTISETVYAEPALAFSSQLGTENVDKTPIDKSTTGYSVF